MKHNVSTHPEEPRLEFSTACGSWGHDLCRVARLVVLNGTLSDQQRPRLDMLRKFCFRNSCWHPEKHHGFMLACLCGQEGIALAPHRLLFLALQLKGACVQQCFSEGHMLLVAPFHVAGAQPVPMALPPVVLVDLAWG